MFTRKEFKKLILEKFDDINYDETKDIIICNGEYIPFEIGYQNFIKKNGMSFDCIYDAHWELMSVIKCTECGTVVKYFYDEDYEPNFRCPKCTKYETSYEYYTKDQIESDNNLKAIIKMYEELNQMDQERYKRKEKRNGLEDYELCRTKQIKIGDNTYDFKLLIDSILNKNKLEGLNLEITKWKIETENSRSFIYKKTIPLSKSAYVTLKRNTSNRDIQVELKNKSIMQILEDEAVKKLRI